MLERIVENWLTNVNELSYQSPFCQLLTGEGHQVIHQTRHGSYEEGKDVISRSPNGVPCAYQLKGGKITLKAWEKIVPQITRLVEVPIVHPSINPKDNLSRQVYLVTNDQIDEEVRIEIAHRNLEWELRGLPKLQIIVGGELLQRFLRLHSGFSPLSLSSEKMLLEFFLADGENILNKSKLADFIISLLPVETVPTNVQLTRSLASTAILMSYILNPYVLKNNHVALIEGWTVFIACIVLVVNKYQLDQSFWHETYAIAIETLESGFRGLVSELKEREHLVEGNILVDGYFYRGRVTWLVGLVSVFALWNQARQNNWTDSVWAKEFVLKYRSQVRLWGEAATPQILAMVWYLRTILSTPEPDSVLCDLINRIAQANSYSEPARVGIPHPYKDLPTVVAEQNGISIPFMPETFKGRSYSLEALIHLYVRRGWRQELKSAWRDITYVDLAEFVPDEIWQYCLWKVRHGGSLVEKQPNSPQSWKGLQIQADSVDETRIPTVFRENAELFLLFLLVYPQRLNANFAKFLDNKLNK